MGQQCMWRCPMAIRMLIADDHGVLRAALRAILKAEPDIEVIAEAANGKEALQLANELQPDLILLDLSMPGLGGVDVTRQLKEILPTIKVLILTVHKDNGLLKEAIRAGANGYILKQAVESELIEAIHAVWRGDLYVHPTMTQALLKALSQTRPIQDPPLEMLTPREVEILQLIVQGYTNRQMADKLSISIRTVESHRGNLMTKLNMRSRVDLVRYATEHNLVD